MTGDRVRVGVWGVGPHALDKVIPAIVASRRCVLVGVSTRDSTILADAATRFTCRSWPNPEEMLADSQVDAVYLATPIGLHDAQARRILAAGKHVWCEKSLTHDAACSLALVGAGRDLDLAVCEAFMYIHHPQFTRVREIVEHPSFGAIASVTARFGMPSLARPGFRHDAALGGGAFLDVGCYPVHFASQLLGTPTAGCAQVEHHGHSVDLEGWAEMSFASGRALLEWGYGLAYRNEALVWGRNASVMIERVFSKRPTDETTIVIADATGNTTIERVAAASAFVPMFDALAATVTDRVERERWWNAAERQARAMAILGAGVSSIPSRPPSSG